MSELYTVTAARVEPGIVVSQGCIVLGQVGRSRREVRIPVPPELVRDGRVHRATLVSRGGRVEIIPEEPGSTGVVLRIRAEGCYTKYTTSSIRLGAGLTEIVYGVTAWGDAGNLGTHRDALIGWRPTALAAAIVTFAGGRRKGYGARLVVVAPSPAPELPPVALYDLPDEGDLPLTAALDPAQLVDGGRLDRVLAALPAEHAYAGRIAALRARSETARAAW